MSKYKPGDIIEDENGTKLVVCKDSNSNCGNDTCYYSKGGPLGSNKYCCADHIDCFEKNDNVYFKVLYDVQLPENKETGIDKALNEIVDDVKNTSTDEYNGLYNSVSDSYDDLRDKVFYIIDNAIPEQHRKNFMTDMFGRYPELLDSIEHCTWKKKKIEVIDLVTEYYAQTSCDNDYYARNGWGNDFVYCPYCGKKIVPEEYVEE